MAATANATLIHEMARVMGIEARAVMNVNLEHLHHGGRTGNCTSGGPGGVGGRCTGNSTEIQTRGGFLSIYGPTMNIIRDPRWGRAQESVSEDPYLNALYASSFVKGLQGDVRYKDDTVGKPLLAAATCKHLAVYNIEAASYAGEHWSRHRFQANVTAQELEETYLLVPRLPSHPFTHRLQDPRRVVFPRPISPVPEAATLLNARSPMQQAGVSGVCYGGQCAADHVQLQQHQRRRRHA